MSNTHPHPLLTSGWQTPITAYPVHGATEDYQQVFSGPWLVLVHQGVMCEASTLQLTGLPNILHLERIRASPA